MSNIGSEENNTEDHDPSKNLKYSTMVLWYVYKTHQLRASTSRFKKSSERFIQKYIIKIEISLIIFLKYIYAEYIALNATNSNKIA